MTRINDLAVLMVLRSASERAGLQCSAEPMSVALSARAEKRTTRPGTQIDVLARLEDDLAAEFQLGA